MSCNTSTLSSGKTIDLCVNPKCTNNHLAIKRTHRSPIYVSKEQELDILKKDLIWFNMNINYYKIKAETCQKRINELE